MLGLDLDGTLVNYGRYPHGRTLFNVAVINDIRAAEHKQVSLITNQGGFPFSLTNNKYMPLDRFMVDLSLLTQRMGDCGIGIDQIHVCTFHPRANVKDCEDTAADLIHKFKCLVSTMPRCIMPPNRASQPLKCCGRRGLASIGAIATRTNKPPPPWVFHSSESIAFMDRGQIAISRAMVYAAALGCATALIVDGRPASSLLILVAGIILATLTDLTHNQK